MEDNNKSSKFKKEELVMIAAKFGLDFGKVKKINANLLKRGLQVEMSNGLDLAQSLKNVIDNCDKENVDEIYPRYVRIKSVVKKI